MTAELFEKQINRLQEKLMLMQQEKVEAECAYLSIINSLSWRLTAPLRLAIRIIKNLRAWLRLQKNKLQSHRSNPSAILLVSHHNRVLSEQVSEIASQVNKTMRGILIEKCNLHA